MSWDFFSTELRQCQAGVDDMYRLMVELRVSSLSYEEQLALYLEPQKLFNARRARAITAHCKTVPRGMP
jgi:hypothetical protein